MIVGSSPERTQDFKKRLVWVALAAIVSAAVVAIVLVTTGPISPSIVAAGALGTLVSFALGGGLMTAVFYSDSGGYDQGATVVLDTDPEDGRSVSSQEAEDVR